jgi:predicted phosphoadenosine phosphosulfate sulfurtransferase
LTGAAMIDRRGFIVLASAAVTATFLPVIRAKASFTFEPRWVSWDKDDFEMWLATTPPGPLPEEERAIEDRRIANVRKWQRHNRQLHAGYQWLT